MAVRSTRDIPHGGNIAVLEPYLERLASALAFAKTAGELRRSPQAEALWEAVYGGLKRSGDSVPHTDRARPQVVRLAMIFALADKAKVIDLPHLQAALSVWEYARASARLLFCGSQAAAAMAEPFWLEVLNGLPEQGTVERWRLNERFKRKASAEAVGEALATLEAGGNAYCIREATGGRTGERWGKGGGGEGEEGERGILDTHTRHHTETNAVAFAGGGEEEVRGEEVGGGEEEVWTVASAGASSSPPGLGRGVDGGKADWRVDLEAEAPKPRSPEWPYHFLDDDYHTPEHQAYLEANGLLPV